MSDDHQVQAIHHPDATFCFSPIGHALTRLHSVFNLQDWKYFTLGATDFDSFASVENDGMVLVPTKSNSLSHAHLFRLFDCILEELRLASTATHIRRGKNLFCHTHSFNPKTITTSLSLLIVYQRCRIPPALGIIIVGVTGISKKILRLFWLVIVLAGGI